MIVYIIGINGNNARTNKEGIYMQHTQEIAQKIVEQENAFIELLQDAGEISREHANRVFNYYVAKKWLKRESITYRLTVKSGNLLDWETIQEVAAIA